MTLESPSIAKKRGRKAGNGGVARAHTAKAPSIAKVAERAGVSIATVSRVINGVPNKMSESTLLRVQDAIAALNYRPMRAGTALRTKQTRLVALLIPDTSNAFYGAIAASVEKALSEERLTMILCNTNEDPDAQDEYLWEMRAHMVRGIALFGAVASPALKEFVADDYPIVFVNRKPPPGLSGPFVGIDNRRAGREVAEHFLERGYTPCGVVHGPLSSSASAERYEGFLGSLTAAGLTLGPEASAAGDLTLEAGYRGADALLAANPRLRAIFCGNDLMAYGAYRLCCEKGLRVPEDIALFGFDDNPLNQWVAPWLSTVRVPYESFGPAVRGLFDRLWLGDLVPSLSRIILPHELVLRASA